MDQTISETEWQFFEEQGYLRLGRTLGGAGLARLQGRIDAIMLGEAPELYGRLLMQLDSETGRYEDAGTQSVGFKGPTRHYRKIQELEHDPAFREYLEGPLFRDLCARAYGPETPIACFRAMFMNKPAERGTLLPWHQDAWASLDRQPLLTVWTALDPATVANGCVEIVPGSHRLGRINPDHPSGFLTDAQAAEFCRETEFLELAPGESVLLHNWLLHRSDRNATLIPRRAFSVCYMDARTQASDGSRFTPIFGSLAHI